MCAHALARARARSGDAAMIYACMGDSGVFSEAVGEFAIEYREQNRTDYRAFVRAIREEQVKAVVEQ